jgi:hypothetical protein
MKKLIKHYRDAIQLVQDLDKKGLVSVEMPPINFFVSPKLDPSSAHAALEAMRAYASVYSALQVLVMSTQSVSAALAIWIAMNMVWG